MSVNISITAGQDESSSSVNASGSIEHIITGEERETFRLTNAELKGAVNAYFDKRPNDAYLHSPTPWGDLYQTYNWPQVKVKLVVQSAEILAITSEPVALKNDTFVNNSSQTATFNTSLTDSVTNTASSNWSTGGTLSISQSFTYGVSFLGTGGEGETSLSYSQSWGVGGEKSTSFTVGSTSGLTVELEPGEGVLAQLYATRGVMKVRIKYKAYLIGRTAVNYNPKYKGHHFWSFRIGSVMSAADISNSVQSIEDIEIGYYSNSRIELRDLETNTLKKSFILADLPGYE